MLIELVVFTITVVLTFAVYSHRKVKNYFEERGIKYVPGIPVFGNTFNSMLKKKHLAEDIDAVYKVFPHERYVGYIEGTKPVIILRDPELIKEVTVKHFDHFIDRKEVVPAEVEPLFGDSVFGMSGERWKEMRATLSPAFTSSKMRMMMPFMTEISNNIVEHVKGHIGEEMNADDLIRRYTNDVIASAAFGLQVNSLKDKENKFYTLGQRMFNFPIYSRILFVITFMFPNIAKKLGFSIFPRETTSFFKNIVFSTMDHREKNKVERPDMIQLLMEASKGKLTTDKDDMDEITDYVLKTKTSPSRVWSQNELVGQVFIFFLAAFESSASTLALLLHEMALNEQIQDKLYQEVKEFQEKNGRLTYEKINDLKYLNCVLSEALRKWAVAIALDRVCTKPFELPPPREGGKPCEVKPGDILYSPVNSIHLDPEYYPSPEVFDPERFSDENKRDIKPFTFLPFGVGPRNCIGYRFAMMELKVLLYYMALNFKAVKCDKTTDPIELAPEDIKIMAKGQSWVKFELRQ